MKINSRKWLPFLLLLFAASKAAYGQEATVTGTITDATGAVLPGVTVVAVHQASGNQFEGVTDGRGVYRIPVRVGAYRISADLAGFTRVERMGVQLLVGQTVTLSMQMSPSTIQETVTVTGEAPLIETTQSTVGGNIDPLQMSEVPVQGNQWLALALLAPGNRTTQIGDEPVAVPREDNPAFALNLDGQQVGNTLGALNQPRYSRETIAEFEFVSNRFDATQGRSPAAMVNAVTKSGTNTFSGLLRGSFRDNEWGAEDHVLNQKVPFTNQQISAAAGGPIVRDRVHYFGNYEYNRTPLTSIARTAYPYFNISLSGKETINLYGGRLDYQFSPNTRLMVKGDGAQRFTPFGTLGANFLAGANSTDEDSWRVLSSLVNVLSNRALNEVKVGYSYIWWNQQPPTRWSNHPQAANGITVGNPIIRLRGFQIAGSTLQPRIWEQKVTTLRDDFTFSYDAGGRHDLKAGGEFLWSQSLSTNCNNCMGLYTARGGPAPSEAEMRAMFPDLFNVDTWNLAPLNPLVQRYEIAVGDFYRPDVLPKYGAWIQDDWQISNRLTLNLGLRYDLIWNAFAQHRSFLQWMAPDRPQDANNLQPRLGFAFSLNDRTVIRGGSGLYYADIPAAALNWAQLPQKVAFIGVQADGRSSFAVSPFNGPRPSYDQALERFCYVRNVPGCLYRDLGELPPYPEVAGVPLMWQSSVGFQRQFAANTALTADYVYFHGADENILLANINVTYDQATRANYPASNIPRRFDPLWGIVGMDPKTGWSNYHGLQAAFTKRLSNRWQASATYTLSGFWNGDPQPISGFSEVPFPVAKDLGNDYSLAVTDQRHRAVLNGIWQIGGGFQLSGIYFFGSGERTFRYYEEDLRGLGEGFEAFAFRLRPDGSLVPRNGFVGDPVHRVDIRLQERIPIAGRVAIDAMVEVFNLFNRANFGSYVTDELSPLFGQPEYNNNLAYAPRTLQLGFRLTF
jgi:Carboxypeptidase regulatory-like domain